MYEEIVVRGGVSPDYFFNEMDYYECLVYIKGLRKRERTELERVRLMMWAALVPHSKNGLELEDVLKLGVEDNEGEKEDIENERAEMAALRQRAKMMEERLNEQHIC